MLFCPRIPSQTLIPAAVGKQNFLCFHLPLRHASTRWIAPLAHVSSACSSFPPSLVTVFCIIQLSPGLLLAGCSCCLAGDCPFSSNPSEGCSNRPSSTKPPPSEPTNQQKQTNKLVYAYMFPRWIPTNQQVPSVVFYLISTPRTMHINTFLTAR